jgi:hypothetical protein
LDVIHEVEAWFRLVVDAGACCTFAFLVLAARRDLRRGRRLARRQHRQLVELVHPVPEIRSMVSGIHEKIVTPGPL